MIGFNHALAGGLIARYLPLPIALPVALASHFCLDSLPHYGLPHHQRDFSKAWRMIFIADFFAAVGLVALPFAKHDLNILWGGLVAVSPDFVWVSRVMRTKSFDLSDNRHWFTKWHARIQGYERPWGIWVEAPLAVILFLLVIR